MKKLLSAAIAVLMLVMQVSAAGAVSSPDPLSSDSIYIEANNVVNIALQQGIVPGQAEGDISALYLADSIPLYEVTSDNTLMEVSSIKYYPVIDQGGAVRGLVIATLQEGNTSATLEYNTMLSSALTAFKQSSANICLIFDQIGIYVYDGSNTTLVLDGCFPHSSRGTYSDSMDGLAQLCRGALVARDLLTLTATCDPSVSGLLSVPIVQQGNWEEGCWAACAISVGEYVGTPIADYDVDDIMTLYANGQDVSKTIYTIQTVLIAKYRVSSSVAIDSLMLTTVVDNIGTGTPVVARVSYEGWSKGHFIVVCGYTVNTAPTESYVSIMDPLSSSYRIIATERIGSDSMIKYVSLETGKVYETDFYLTVD